jgi:hypothetical protein
MSGAFGSAWACRRVSHLPDLTPIDFALFARALPAANSGASSPLSVAATAGLRMADMRTMMDDDPRPQAFALQLLGWNPCAGATRITGPKPTSRS